MEIIPSILKYAFYTTVCVAGVPLSSCKSYDTKSVAAKIDTVKTAEAIKTTTPSFTYDSTKHYIYFTCDDGPQNGTMNCYHILRDLNVKASFFMITVQIDNARLQKDVDSIRNGYPEFLLANHSFTHANFNHYTAYFHQPDSAFRDFVKAQQVMQVPLKICRMPGNNSWAIKNRLRCTALTKELCYKLDSAGYNVTGWDVEWNFKNESGSIPVQSADHMIKEVNDAFKNNRNFNSNHVVILVHDRMFAKKQYADSLYKFIATLKKDPQNEFETIDHYPGLNLNN